jgi:hypothetical protein
MACVVGEHVGSATYYINNQSDLDLYYVFPIPDVRLTPDTTKIIVSKSSNEIHQDGIIGVNPTPSMTFEFIWLYASINDSIKVVYNHYPVIDEEWIIIEQNLGKSGYGSTVYELLIENSDLDLN